MAKDWFFASGLMPQPNVLDAFLYYEKLGIFLHKPRAEGVSKSYRAIPTIVYQEIRLQFLPKHRIVPKSPGDITIQYNRVFPLRIMLLLIRKRYSFQSLCKILLALGFHSIENSKLLNWFCRSDCDGPWMLQRHRSCLLRCIRSNWTQNESQKKIVEKKTRFSDPRASAGSAGVLE